MFFIKFENFLDIISSNIMFSFFCLLLWNSHNAFIRLCSLFFNLFFFMFPRLNNFHCPNFKFIDSFFCLLRSALNPSSIFFISVNVLFNFRISFWFIFRFSISLFFLMFPFCSYIFVLIFSECFL